MNNSAETLVRIQLKPKRKLLELSNLGVSSSGLGYSEKIKEKENA
jgi:hypothetical protein